jgi:hypothetical protein
VSLKSHLARSRFAVDEPALIGSLSLSLGLAQVEPLFSRDCAPHRIGGSRHVLRTPLALARKPPSCS